MTSGGPLAGKVALVTGGGRGLGRSACLALAESGADIVAGSRSADQLAKLGADVQGLGRRCVTAATDVTCPASVDALVRLATAELGRLDVVVSNAGIIHQAPILGTTDEDWDAVVATNLRGTFLVLRAAGHVLTAQGSGKVINVASHWGLRGVPGHASYCASKAAIVNLTRTAAAEWARYGVQVNAIAPGYFATEINAHARADPALNERILKGIPMRRMGEPAEFGRWVVLLASEATSFMTGETIVLDGGESAL
jgi:NAD(P)-dependent dehydrogenase (short-subunit alcohol dehydrogenase family)